MVFSCCLILLVASPDIFSCRHRTASPGATQKKQQLDFRWEWRHTRVPVLFPPADLTCRHNIKITWLVKLVWKKNVSVWWLAAVDSPLPASSFSFSTCLNHDLGEMNIMESTVTVIYFCSFTLCVIQLRVWCLALQLLSGPPLSSSLSNPNVFQLSAFIRLEDWVLEVLTAVLPRWNCLGRSAMLFSPSLNSQKRDGYFREMRLSWAFELLLCSSAVVDSSDLTQTSSVKANILGYIFKENDGYLDFLLLWST